MRRRDDHGLHNLVLAIALGLAAVVLYFVVSGWLNRPSVRVPRIAPDEGPSDASKPQPGMSETFQAVTSIPPLMIQKTGRPAAARSKAPPSPATRPDGE